MSSTIHTMKVITYAPDPPDSPLLLQNMAGTSLKRVYVSSATSQPYPLGIYSPATRTARITISSAEFAALCSDLPNDVTVLLICNESQRVIDFTYSCDPTTFAISLPLEVVADAAEYAEQLETASAKLKRLSGALRRIPRGSLDGCLAPDDGDGAHHDLADTPRPD